LVGLSHQLIGPTDAPKVIAPGARRRIEASFASLDDTVHHPLHDADHADLLRERIDGASAE
jgi:hypothetical protein